MIVTFHWKIPTESLCDPMRITSEQNNVKEDSTSVVSSLLLIYR